MSFLDKFKQMFAQKSSKKALPRINVSKRFELLGRTGQGSMSKVWRARDRQLGRVVCLKVLDKIKTDKFEARFPGLKRPSEGTICMELKHKNVVTTFEHGLTFEREQYLVMELIEGMGLNFLIETRSPHLEGKRLDLLGQIAAGLGYVHKRGYMHRDVCPRNIMVTNDGVVKIIDFGLTIPYRPEFCRPGNRTGTPNYLAPEVIKRVTTDHRVDMFALGVTAYEMLVGGALPWEKTEESRQLLVSRVNNPARDPRDYSKDMDTKTAEFLIKSVDRDPARRFQDTDDFLQALRGLPPQ